MTYNYKNEYLKWKQWKEKEEQLLRELEVNENIIQDLHDFDWQQFNSERKFRRYQNVTNDIYFLIAPFYDQKDINNVEDILDLIEYESLYEYLLEIDPIVLDILLLKIKGFSVKEISQILNIPISSIYQEIKKIKTFLKNFRK